MKRYSFIVAALVIGALLGFVAVAIAQPVPERQWGRSYLGVVSNDGTTVSPVRAATPLPVAGTITCTPSGTQTVDGAVAATQSGTWTVTSEAECEPDLSVPQIPLGPCIAAGTATVEIPAGRYLLTVLGETTEILEGATSMTAGDGVQIPASRSAPYTVETTTDFACHSVGETGGARFAACK